MHNAIRGLSLLEVIAALSVAALLLTVGVPTFHGIINNSRRTATINDLVATVQIARTTAIRRNRQLVICPDDGRPRCDGSADWSQGWLVFVNEDFDRPPSLDDNETVIHRHGPLAPLRVYSNRSYFAFHRIGLRSTNGTLTLCDNRGSTQARAVIISYTGRPRVSARKADGSPLECL